MKNLDAVIDALDVLWNNVETKFERHRVRNLILDLLKGPPKVEVIDDTHQKFNGVTYNKDTSGHYARHQHVHREVWEYYNGEIPEGYVIHHIDCNPENNDIENLQLMTQSEHRYLHSILTIGSKICPTCGKSFEATESVKYCSSKCKNKAKYSNANLQRQCLFCGKIFKANTPYVKYCSTSCSSKHFHQRRREKLKKETFICAECGKEISGSQKVDGKFCSQKCKNQYCYKNARESRKCPICGKIFDVFKYSHQTCCSKSCANKLRQQKTYSKSVPK